MNLLAVFAIRAKELLKMHACVNVDCHLANHDVISAALTKLVASDWFVVLVCLPPSFHSLALKTEPVMGPGALKNVLSPKGGGLWINQGGRRW